MLSSITPLGQRGRGMSWGRTVVAFWVGAVTAGAVVFGALGVVGEMIGVPALNPWYSITVLAFVAILDVSGIKSPGITRQRGMCRAKLQAFRRRRLSLLRCCLSQCARYP